MVIGDVSRGIRTPRLPILIETTLPPHSFPRGPAITYLTPLFAIVVGIVHAGLSPTIVIADVSPNLVLVAVVLVTALRGFLPGITFAFVGGLTANLLVGAPLGSVPLAMLAVAVATAGGARLMGRMTWIYPVLAAFVGSAVADVVTLSLAQLVAAAPPLVLPAGIVFAAAILNAAIAGIILSPARRLAGRYAGDEAAAW